LEWFGHVVRMDQGRTVKRFSSKPEGSRIRGRPKLRERCINYQLDAQIIIYSYNIYKSYDFFINT
jgi:hypothetical protein